MPLIFALGFFATLGLNLLVAGASAGISFLMGRRKKQKGRQAYIDATDFTSASDGSPLRRTFGPKVRCPGVIYWTSKVLQVVTSAQEVHNHIDCGVAWCRGPLRDANTPTTSILEIWGGDIQIFRQNNQIVYQTIEVPPSSGVFENVNVKRVAMAGGTEFMAEIRTPYTPETNPVPTFRKGDIVSISGLANATNNGDFPIIYWGLEDGLILWRVENNGAANEDQSAQAVTWISAAPDYDLTFTDGVGNFGGDQTQPQPVVHAEDTGVGRTPHYSNVAHSTFRKLRLRRFGNNIPDFWALIEKDNEEFFDVGDAIVALCDDAGLQGRTVFQDLAENFDGYYVGDPEPTAISLEPLMAAFDVVSQEAGGVIVFRNREDVDQLTVPADRMAAQAGENPEPKSVLDIGEKGRVKRERSIILDFLEPSNQYQRSSVTGKLNLLRPGGDPTSDQPDYDFDQAVMQTSIEPVQISRERAQTVANRMLYRKHGMQREISFTVGPRYFDIQESDIINVTAYGTDWAIYVKNVERGSDYVIRIEGLILDHGEEFMGPT